MIGDWGFSRGFGRGVFLSAAVLAIASGPASAADLGGNCCADLEERVAELEATTARKGNRKVSLTVSGWVNEAVFFWDDGVEQNTYVGTNELEQSRFRFNGDAKINGDWGAGYILEIGVNGAGSSTFSQSSTGASAVAVRKSAWFLKSKTFGKLTVGRFDTATYHLLDNVDTTLTRNVSDYEAAGRAIGQFQVRVNGAFRGFNGGANGRNYRWTDLMTGFNVASAGQSGLRNTVRYDTPEIAGFIASASWGEDDMGEIALKYKGEFSDFKYNAAIGYGESTDPTVNTGNCNVGGANSTGNCQWWAAGALVSHTPTGIFVYGGVGQNKIELLGPAAAGGDDTSTTWYLQAGIEKKWLSFGKTNIFGEYRNDDTGFVRATGGTAPLGTVTGADLDLWAAGIAQNFESADLTLYALYRHYSGDVQTTTGSVGLDDFDMVITGAKINF